MKNNKKKFAQDDNLLLSNQIPVKPLKTKEELLKQFSEFYFIDIPTLSPITDRIEAVQNDTNKETQLLNASGIIFEQIEMVKLRTIGNYLSMKEGFHKNHYKRLLTLASQKTDELGIIGVLGSKFTPEEFDLYLEVFNELYKPIESN